MSRALSLPPRARGSDRSWPALFAPAAGAALAVPVGLLLSGVRPPLVAEAAAALALLAVVALGVLRFDATVALAFALLGVVLVEPAPSDLVLFVVVAIALVTGRFQPRVPPVVLAALGALLALNLFSAVEVVDTGRAVAFLATTAYLVVFALWLSGYVGSRERARIVVGGYLVAAAVSALIGLAALFVGLPGGDQLVGDGRVQALFQDPNVFGPFLVPVALILLEDILTPRLFALRRMLKAALMLLLVLGVAFSFSRGAWVNLAVGVAVVLTVVALRRKGGRKALVASLLTVVAAAAVAATIATTGSQSLMFERAGMQSYDATRFSAQAVGIESAERYPFGVGPGQFERYASLSAHSTYVRVAGEQGFPGLVALAVFVVTTLVVALGNALAGRDCHGVGSAALLGAWCGLLVNSLVVDTLHWRHLWVVAALVWIGWARKSSGFDAHVPLAQPRRNGHRM
jgi:O-antigen ligase